MKRLIAPGILGVLAAFSGVEIACAQNEAPPPPAAEAPKSLQVEGAEPPPEAASRGGSALQPDTDLIDVPTAGILDYGGWSSRTRFFSTGGIVEWLNFGVFHRVNIGASFNIDRFLGTDSPVQLTRPELQLKLRCYDGDRTLPAVTVGFDGQGYLYNRPDRRYNQRQHGLYVVGSHEVLLPGLEGHAGMNISDFDSNSIFGFMASSFNLRDKVLLMAEWDNINTAEDSRINMGFRVFVTPEFNIDFAGRGIGLGGRYSNGVPRGAERIVMFKYTGNF